MNKHFFKSRIYKMGPKLGLFISNDMMLKLGIKKGEYVKIVLISNGKETTFLSKFNYLITIRKQVINSLCLKPNQEISLNVEKADVADKSYSLFNKGKIDMLSLISDKTRLGFEILVNKFIKNDEEWLGVWYCFNRGSCKEIKLRRFVDIKKFGKLLGLIQSEGSKTNIDVVEFCNKSTQEHLDFLDYIGEVGFSKDWIIGKLDYHPRIKNIKEIIEEFEKKSGVKIRYIVAGPTSGGGYGFKLIIRSRLFSEIISKSLDKIRSLIKNKNTDSEIVILRDAFFSKLLNGDGDLEIITKNRKTPQLRLKITDCNLNYLEDYKLIMETYGFIPHILKKYIFVRSYVNYDSAKRLVQMEAFKNNPNYAKLLKFIKFFERDTSPKAPSGL